jgi:hypothetical protein
VRRANSVAYADANGYLHADFHTDFNADVYADARRGLSGINIDFG